MGHVVTHMRRHQNAELQVAAFKFVVLYAAKSGKKSQVANISRRLILLVCTEAMRVAIRCSGMMKQVLLSLSTLGSHADLVEAGAAAVIAACIQNRSLIDFIFNSSLSNINPALLQETILSHSWRLEASASLFMLRVSLQRMHVFKKTCSSSCTSARQQAV
jgi:hypothetical protein